MQSPKPATPVMAGNPAVHVLPQRHGTVVEGRAVLAMMAVATFRPAQKQRYAAAASGTGQKKFAVTAARASSACMSGFLSPSGAVSASIGANNSWACGS